MISSVAALLLLAAPGMAEWRCPEPPPAEAGAERALLLKLIGTRGQSAAGSFTDDLFFSDPDPFRAWIARGAQAATALALAEERALREEIRQAARDRLAALPIPGPDPEAAELAAAMLACAKTHPGQPLPLIEAWAREQSELEPWAVLAQIVADPPHRGLALDARDAAIRVAGDGAALDRLALRLLQLEAPAAAAEAWREAAERAPTDPALPAWLDACAALPLSVQRGREPWSGPTRGACLTALVEATAPRSDWRRAQPRALRGSVEPLRADAELDLAALGERGQDPAALAEALEAWLRAYPRDARAPRIRWLARAAALRGGQVEEVLEALVGRTADPRDTLLRLEALARRWASLPEDAPQRAEEERRSIEETRALGERSFPEPALQVGALKLGLALAVGGYRAARMRGDPSTAEAWWRLIVAGELPMSAALRIRGEEGLVDVGLPFFALAAVPVDEPPLPWPPLSAAPSGAVALLEAIEGDWEAWAQQERPALRTLRKSRDREERKAVAREAATEHDAALASAYLLGLRQILGAEALLATQDPEARIAGHCSLGLAWAHLHALDIGGPRSWYPGIYYPGVEFLWLDVLEETWREPTRAHAVHQLEACLLEGAREQLRPPLLERAELAWHQLDPQRPDPRHQEQPLPVAPRPPAAASPGPLELDPPG